MKSPFLQTRNAKRLLTINLIMAFVYFIGLLILFQRGNVYLYTILIVGEIFHVWQAATLIHAAWDTHVEHEFSPTFEAPVDIFITVAGEPKEVVRKTLNAAVQLDYPNFKVYILNDGLVAKKSNWREMEELADEFRNFGVKCLTRQTPGGAKAGNINHALKRTTAPFVAILDCDHIPRKYFLQRSMGYFIDSNVAFVQSPQYYRNNTETYVANAAWQQQTVFFGPICRGKDRVNSLFMCGTNMVIRRAALDDVGGMKEDSITEDLMTSIVMHAHGWKSVYVPRILAGGLAPEDFRSYWSQQFRWARGSLEVLFRHNPLTMRGLTWSQRIQYLASVTFYLNGLIMLADALLPLFYFFGGRIPITSATMAIALIFIPYIFMTLYALQVISNFAFSFRAIAFAIASWPIHLTALVLTLLRIKSGFSITSKERKSGNYLHMVWPHIIYIILTCVGIVWAGLRDGISPSLITNASWGLLYVAMFLPFIRAAMSDRAVEILPISDAPLPAEEVIRES